MFWIEAYQVELSLWRYLKNKSAYSLEISVLLQKNPFIHKIWGKSLNEIQVEQSFLEFYSRLGYNSLEAAVNVMYISFFEHVW